MTGNRRPARIADRPDCAEVHMGHGATYRVRVRGQLGSEWSSWFEGLTVDAEPDGTTVLTGELADQAALHGLLAAIRDLGLELLSVETISGLAPRPRNGAQS